MDWRSDVCHTLIQHTALFTVHNILCTVNTVQCTVCVVQCTVHTVHCTVISARCTVHSAHCTGLSARSTVHSKRCTVHSARCSVRWLGSQMNILMLFWHLTHVHTDWRGNMSYRRLTRWGWPVLITNPQPNTLYHLVLKKKIACDLWHMTYDQWQVGGDEPFLKISAP